MKIVYINVASRTDRRDFMEGQLQALGLSAERIEAVTPADLTREQIDRYCDASRGAFLMPLELCCGLSHLRALRSVLVSGADRAIILEDDAVLSSRLPAFLQDFEQLSLACDLLRLETTFERTRLLASQMPACGGIAIQIPYSWASGSGAYLISRRGAQLAVASEELLRKPADRAMCNPYEPIPRRLGLKQVNPALAVQADRSPGAPRLPSDIGNSRGDGMRLERQYFWRRRPHAIAEWINRDIVIAAQKAWHEHVRGARKQVIPFLP